MKNILVGLAFLLCSVLLFAGNEDKQVLFLQKGEKVWTGVVNDGARMPLKPGYKMDFKGDNKSNQVQPLILTTAGQYVWCEEPFAFEMKEDCVEISSTQGKIIMGKVGSTLREARQYVADTFFPASGLLPDTILFSSPQYNTWIELNYNQNQEDVLKYARAILDNGFPPGVITIDDSWQEDFGVWKFHPKRFPDPKKMIGELHRMGFKVSLWVCPFVSPDQEHLVREFRENNPLLLRNVTDKWGNTSQVPYIIQWWNGYSAILDMSNPDACKWFEAQLNFLMEEYGIDGFKFDGGNMEYYPDDAIDKTFVAIKGEAKKKLRVAIANTKIYEKYFEDVLKDVYDRSLDRYEKLEEILRLAVKEKVDMIVFPECYLPYEWLARLYRFSATNKIAIISGIEIIALNHSDENSFQKDILNLTAVILPYKINNYSFAYMAFHEKIHFSPEEQRMVVNYSHFPREGKTLQMFYWHDVFFSVYCCFEIASISLRSAFKNYLDLFVAVECNKDINYFSNVMGSLCRDMHCYCLQVNTSDYGDSRLIKPASSVKMNMMRIKGGCNEAILVEDVDIDGLRNFQRKQYELQRDEKDKFKTTPPGFDVSIVDAKLHKRLVKRIQEELRMD